MAERMVSVTRLFQDSLPTFNNHQSALHLYLIVICIYYNVARCSENTKIHQINQVPNIRRDLIANTSPHGQNWETVHIRVALEGSMAHAIRQGLCLTAHAHWPPPANSLPKHKSVEGKVLNVYIHTLSFLE